MDRFDLWDDSVSDDWPAASQVRSYFENKNVFLTGATGGVGQCIVQKLLRIKCGDIYLLVRPKKGKTAFERISEILDSVLFQKARQENPNFMAKIKLIEGDIEKKNLGITERDMDHIIRNVHIVFHVAADVRFDQSMKHAVYNNVRSVRDVLEMCCQMKKLESFVYMSTAYSNNESFIDEKLYKCPVDPDKLINLMERIDGTEEEKIVDILTSRMIRPWDTTYTYTKNIAEYLVERYSHKFPAAVIRPSIIIATDQDPIAGWTDNIYGLNGVMLGFGMGLLRILYTDKSYVGDVIPLDYVANSTLAVSWNTCKIWKNRKTNEQGTNLFKIYNCVSSPDNPQKWGEVDQILDYYRKFPTINMMWYTSTNYTSSFTMFKFYTIIYHCIPAFFVDKYLAWKGEKVRLMKVYRLIQKNINLAACFMQNWRFANKNMRDVYDSMSSDDHIVFPCDIRNVKWMDYNSKYCLGLRVYVGKDPLHTMKKAQQKKFKLMIAHYIFLVPYYMVCGWIWYNILWLVGWDKYVNVNSWIEFVRSTFVSIKQYNW